MKKYSEYLADKEREKQEAKVVYPYTENDEINYLRQLVEDMTKWMSIGSYKQKTPHYVVAEFKTTMKKANKVKRENAYTRGLDAEMDGVGDE
tara:strand:- start:270 stop:545 length:276 start_codon:yes stop_codon:yes gene_type:complete